MLYNELLERLQKLTFTKVSQKTIAECLGVGQSAIGNRAARNSEFSLDELIKIERALGLPIGSVSGIQGNDNCVDIDYYADVWASCGTGAMVFEEASEKISIPKTVIQNYSANNKYSIINSRGDSMYPFCLDRDKLVIEHWQGGQIIDNAIYVFRYENELFVKRLIKNVTQIIIKSDNPNYKPIEISGKDPEFEIIGKIVGLMREMV